MDVEIKEEVLAVMNRMREVLRKKEPILRIVGEVILSSVQKNFLEEGRPEPWEPLAPSTLRQRERQEYVNPETGKAAILRRGNNLFNSIHYEVEGDSVSIGPGSNIEYAAIHQFGGYAGRGHRAHIPARPYLMVQEEDWGEIERELYGLLNAVWNGRVIL